MSRCALAVSEVGERYDDDLPLVHAASADAGLAVEVVRWDAPDVDWAAYDLVVVRSCWDYTWRVEEFLAWAGAVPRLRNPVEVLRWNADKTYLRDLAGAGCPVVPTVWDPASVQDLPDAQEWVVKPSVSAGARDTARWSTPADALSHVRALQADGRTAMVQPYLTAVDAAGETALLHFGGAFSHAVRKGPLLRPGDGPDEDRVGREELSPATARPEQRAVAAAALAAVPAVLGPVGTLLYARVDLVDGPDGAPVLLELELVEPSLFLPEADGAAERFVRAVREELRLPGPGRS